MNDVYQFNKRVERALSERIHLLDEDNYNYIVQGSREVNYQVKFTDKCVSCTCPDFIRRNKLCKHIIFIIYKVYKQNIIDIGNIKNIDDTENIDSPNKNFLDLLKKNNNNKNENENENKNKNIKDFLVKFIGSCAICFDDVDDGYNDNKCRICVGIFHSDCIRRWILNKNNCPLCRSKWSL